MTSWAGSPSYREKALLRCQQAHRLLGEAIKKEHVDWIDKVHVELAFNMNAGLHKFAVRRHFKRPDWIQCNLFLCTAELSFKLSKRPKAGIDFSSNFLVKLQRCGMSGMSFGTYTDPSALCVIIIITLFKV